MAVYSKICPICTDLFECAKITTIYCSKKCNNRSRRLDSKTLAQIINKVSKFTLVCNDNTLHVRTKQGEKVIVKGYEPENITENNPLGSDEGLLKALAIEELQKRKNEQERQRLASLKSETGFGVVVEESDNITKEEFKQVSNDIYLKSQPLQQPKKFKIKPIQRNGGEK